MRGGAGAVDVSDSEEDEEVRSNPGSQNGRRDRDEDDDLTQWTLDTFTSRPVGGDSATNTVSLSPSFAVTEADL